MEQRAGDPDTEWNMTPHRASMKLKEENMPINQTIHATESQFQPLNEDIHLSEAEETGQYDDIHFDLNQRYSPKDMEKVFSRTNSQVNQISDLKTKKQDIVLQSI